MIKWNFATAKAEVKVSGSDSTQMYISSEVYHLNCTLLHLAVHWCVSYNNSKQSHDHDLLQVSGLPCVCVWLLSSLYWFQDFISDQQRVD